LLSLQDAIAEVKEDGYHGYSARAGDVVASLLKIAVETRRVDAIRNPPEAIELLLRRLRSAFANHFAIHALR
jgi:hypothetical protein